MDGVELEFTADALQAVAAAALRQGTGARGLRSILERVLLDAMYDLPDHEDVRKIVIHREVIGGTAPPVQVHVDERRSEEHTSELQSLMRISYAVFCLKKTNTNYRT